MRNRTLGFFLNIFLGFFLAIFFHRFGRVRGGGYPAAYTIPLAPAVFLYHEGGTPLHYFILWGGHPMYIEEGVPYGVISI